PWPTWKSMSTSFWTRVQRGESADLNIFSFTTTWNLSRATSVSTTNTPTGKRKFGLRARPIQQRWHHLFLDRRLSAAVGLARNSSLYRDRQSSFFSTDISYRSYCSMVSLA